MSVGVRPRVLVLNQYYWPGVEATAHLLSQLCAALAEDFEVTVVTGRLRDADGTGRLERDGVEILRVPSTAFDRRRLALRAVNYLTYLGSSLASAIATRPPDVVLCMTDPPVIGDVPPRPRRPRDHDRRRRRAPGRARRTHRAARGRRRTLPALPAPQPAPALALGGARPRRRARARPLRLRRPEPALRRPLRRAA